MSASSRRTRVRAASVAAVGAALLLVQVSASALSGSAPAPASTSVGGGVSTATVTTPSTPSTTPAVSSPYTSSTSSSPATASVATSTTATTQSAATSSLTTAAVPSVSQKVRAAVPSGTPWNTPIPASTTPTATPTAGATTPPAYAGWRTDWVDNLSVPIAQTKWGRYGWNNEAPGQGAMGLWSPANTFTSNGVMTLRTQYANGVWTSAGVSSGDLFSASGGRWEFRAKFPVSKGIQYAFLLYPTDGTWPPEIDIIEGRVNGPEVMGAYHYDADNKQSLVFFDNPDMSGWHTYGVIIGATTITYTFDGRPWAVVTNPSVTTKPLWIGFQCSPMDPNGSAKQYETIDNGVPGPLTPAISDIQIDWVAHYVTA